MPLKADGIATLQRLLQTLAFCLAISAIQVAIQPDRPYDVPARYSLCIGLLCWAMIDFGRHLFPSARATGWPQGASALLLPLGAIVGSYLLGTQLADWSLGYSTWQASARPQLRSSIVISVVAGIVGTYYFYSRGRSALLEKDMAEARHQAAEAQLKLLETQLEPHMLFNTLANLRVLIGSDPPRAQAMLDRLIDYLRATLAASRSSWHPLQAEFDRLRDYLELMVVRMGPRLSYQLALPPELAQLPVPTLLLQPLVENSIQHGLEPKIEGGSIRVSARREGNTVLLEITDTGLGPGPAAAPAFPRPTGSGFGLNQVRERLATAYGEAGQLQMSSPADGGCRVLIQLPANP